MPAFPLKFCLRSSLLPRLSFHSLSVKVPSVSPRPRPCTRLGHSRSVALEWESEREARCALPTGQQDCLWFWDAKANVGQNLTSPDNCRCRSRALQHCQLEAFELFVTNDLLEIEVWSFAQILIWDYIAPQRIIIMNTLHKYFWVHAVKTKRI